MPLRAYIEDKEIVSIDLNDEEWSALKARLKAKEIVLTSYVPSVPLACHSALVMCLWS